MYGHTGAVSEENEDEYYCMYTSIHTYIHTCMHAYNVSAGDIRMDRV
jgi:hypothetical protein